MPANRLSLKLTDQYRLRLDALRTRLQSSVRSYWPTIEQLDGTTWTERAARETERAQLEALRTTSGYLSALLTLETGRHSRGPAIDPKLAGFSADGKRLAEGLRSPVIGVLYKLKQGASPAEALRYGRDRATRQVGMDFDQLHHSALLVAIDSDERFKGWQRATSGTCGACLALAERIGHALEFPHHPGCKCVAEPVVSGSANNFPRPTGADLFAAKSEDEQNAAVGPLAAQMLREERIQLPELVSHEEQDSDAPPIYTQRPVDQLVPATT